MKLILLTDLMTTISEIGKRQKNNMKGSISILKERPQKEASTN